MNVTVMVNETARFIAGESRTVAKAAAGFLHAFIDYAMQAPSNVWAMCAFAAATSILVTLVTLMLWPKHQEPMAPVREATDATGVRQLRDQGFDTTDIARRTGMSHDAVATILRARTLQRGERLSPTRKTHPTAA